MVKVIKQEKAHYRIQIYDLVEKRTKTISLANHEKFNIEDIKEAIIKAMETLS